ncbi:MAG TPA: glutamate racemase [Firmicutes bacterium]|mgnify:CR=1 FL=1|nr:glutamate racemase [Bacillota bacterium]
MNKFSEEKLIQAHKAIGVIDSGVGGLTVVKEINRLLPRESIIYFGDTARMPYGPRSFEEVRGFVFQMIDFLQHQEIKMLVVACNSATAAGLSYYQEACELPVIGVIEPGVRAALARTHNGKIGVIGTVGTINSSEYVRALQAKDDSLEIYTKACPLFVLLVENELVQTPEAEAVAHEYLDQLVKKGIDTLILGCTHYPLMEQLIRKVVGPQVELINSAEEIAAEIKRILEETAMLNPLNSGQRRYRFFVSGNPVSFEEIGSKMLRQKIRPYQVQID